jgi:negative regulator of genetic competence, sporulation and motility
MTDLTPYFIDHIKTLLEQAEQQKNEQPKSDKTRYWAVVYTDLEKVLAYVETYIAKGETNDR